MWVLKKSRQDGSEYCSNAHEAAFEPRAQQKVQREGSCATRLFCLGGAMVPRSGRVASGGRASVPNPTLLHPQLAALLCRVPI